MSVDLVRFVIFAGVLVALGLLATRVQLFKPYLRKNPMITFLLGISSGFPLTLLVATMTFWLAKVGIDTATIGFAVALGTPYTIKFLWAPIVDALDVPLLSRWLGRRRAWALVSQAALVLAILGLGTTDPAQAPTLLTRSAVGA